MELSRVALVVAATTGSGYLIGNDRVITARHLFSRDSRIGSHCKVQVVETLQGALSAPQEARIAWLGKASFDVAVLEVLNSELQTSVSPVSCTIGLLDSERAHALPALTVGFPLAATVDQDSFDTFHVGGDILTGSYKLGARLDFDVTTSAPNDFIQWRGLSGAAVFIEDAIVAVVGQIANDRQFGARKLTVTPLNDLVRDPSFLLALGFSAGEDTSRFTRFVSGNSVQSRGARRLVETFVRSHLSQASTSLYPHKIRTLDSLNQWLLESDRPKCLVYAKQSTGKSFLAAYWYSELGSSDIVIPILVPLSANAAFLSNAEEALRHALSLVCDAVDTDVYRPRPNESAELLAEKLAEALDYFGSRGPRTLLLIFDGIDEAEECSWLNQLPITSFGGSRIKVCCLVRETAGKSAHFWIQRLGWNSNEALRINFERFNPSKAISSLPQDQLDGVDLRQDSELKQRLADLVGDSPLLLSLYIGHLAERLESGASEVEILHSLQEAHVDTEDALGAYLQTQMDFSGEEETDSVAQALAWASVPLTLRDLSRLCAGHPSISRARAAISSLSRVLIGSEKTGYVFPLAPIREHFAAAIDSPSEFDCRLLEYAELATKSDDYPPTGALIVLLIDHAERLSLRSSWLIDLRLDRWLDACPEGRLQALLSLALQEAERQLERPSQDPWPTILAHLEITLLLQSIGPLVTPATSLADVYTSAGLATSAFLDSTIAGKHFQLQQALAKMVTPDGPEEPNLFLAVCLACSQRDSYWRSAFLGTIAQHCSVSDLPTLAIPGLRGELLSSARRDYFSCSFFDRVKVSDHEILLEEPELAASCAGIPVDAIWLARTKNAEECFETSAVKKIAEADDKDTEILAVLETIQGTENRVVRDRLARLMISFAESITPQMLAKVSDPWLRVHVALKSIDRLDDDISQAFQTDESMALNGIYQRVVERLLCEQELFRLGEDDGFEMSKESIRKAQLTIATQVTDNSLKQRMYESLLLRTLEGEFYLSVLACAVEDDSIDDTVDRIVFRYAQSDVEPTSNDTELLEELLFAERIDDKFELVSLAARSSDRVLLFAAVSVVQTIEDDHKMDLLAGQLSIRFAELGDFAEANTLLSSISELNALAMTIAAYLMRLPEYADNVDEERLRNLLNRERCVQSKALGKLVLAKLTDQEELLQEAKDELALLPDTANYIACIQSDTPDAPGQNAISQLYWRAGMAIDARKQESYRALVAISWFPLVSCPEHRFLFEWAKEFSASHSDDFLFHYVSLMDAQHIGWEAVKGVGNLAVCVETAHFLQSRVLAALVFAEMAAAIKPSDAPKEFVEGFIHVTKDMRDFIDDAMYVGMLNYGLAKIGASVGKKESVTFYRSLADDIQSRSRRRCYPHLSALVNMLRNQNRLDDIQKVLAIVESTASRMP